MTLCVYWHNDTVYQNRINRAGLSRPGFTGRDIITLDEVFWLMGLAASVVKKYDDCHGNTLLDYNLCLNDCVVFELNEKFIESKINELDEIEAPRRRADGGSSPQGISSVFNLLANPAASSGECACFSVQNSGLIYQLTQARITELTLICAGNYADNFEFTAAGDLLVNPRNIRIHIDGVREPVNKKRHLVLTDQFNAVAKTHTGIINWLGKNTHPEIIKKPLLPDLYERLKIAGIISVKYLDSIYQRMNKIAEVIGFLSAYNLSGNRILYPQFQAASAESDYIKSNLCNFNFDIFFDLGNEILKLIENDSYKSLFIGDKQWR